MKKELENIKPFNKFWFKSCFYHAFLAVAQYYGGDVMNYVRNRFIHYENKNGTFEVVDGGFVRYNEVEGLREHRRRSEAKLFKAIKRRIDSEQPVIVAADSFYLPFRNDTYLKTHIVHYICVYGYDVEKGVVDIVDHKYWGSYQFEKKKVSVLDLTKAYRAYTQTNPDRFTFFWYTPDGKKREFQSRKNYDRDEKLLRGYLQGFAAKLRDGQEEVSAEKAFFEKLSWIYVSYCYIFRIYGKKEGYDAVNNFVNHVRKIWATLTKIQALGMRGEIREKLILLLEDLDDKQKKLNRALYEEQKTWTAL